MIVLIVLLITSLSYIGIAFLVNEKNAKYLLYCRTGKRAAIGMRIMKAMGFKNVKYLIGNYKQIKNVHIGIEDNKN